MLRTSSVHSQEDLYMQFYVISSMRPYQQSDRWQDMLDQALPATDLTAYMEA
jgi:hypothetical protein